MVHDQADELRHLVHLARQERAGVGRARLIVVHGAKGGVGTTTIATNLAVALSRCGRRAVLVDGDLDHSGALAVNSDLASGTVLDVLAGRKTAEETLTRGPANTLILPGAWANAEATCWTCAAQERLIDQLQNLSRLAPFVVIDGGSGRGELARRFWNASDRRVVLCTSEPQSVLEAYAAIKILTDGESRASIHTLVNGEADGRLADDVHARLSKASQNFLGQTTIAAGMVTRHDEGEAADGVLIFPDRSSSARALDRLAGALTNTFDTRVATRAISDSKQQAA